MTIQELKDKLNLELIELEARLKTIEDELFNDEEYSGDWGEGNETYGYYQGRVEQVKLTISMIQ